jgi:hypothetical protein
MFDQYDYAFLLFGIIALGWAVFATYTGEAWTRFGKVVRRDETPFKFWAQVALQYLIGFGLLGGCVYRLCTSSH